jgi:hypothetical protein
MRPALKPQGPAIDRSIADVLEALSRETHTLQRSAEHLQGMAGILIERARLPASDPLIEEAQALDALAQKLDALTGFMLRLSETAPAGWRLDIAGAVEPVFLADLAKRLCREHNPEEANHAPSGDFELF